MLPAVLPLTVEDTIAASLELGIPFIRIDRYRVPQDAEKEKHEQIKNMHRIYLCAEVTLVAVAGEGLDYGLLGVSKRRRVRQIEVLIRSTLLLQTGNDSSETLESSKWHTRAWTFQEVVLSRRRLIFTDDQLYFEGNRMGCRKSTEEPLLDIYDDDHCGSGIRFRTNLIPRSPDQPFMFLYLARTRLGGTLE